MPITNYNNGGFHIWLGHDNGSRCEIYLYDVLGDRIQHVLLAFAHPIPKLSEVDLVRPLSLLLLEVLVENDLNVFQVVEDIVECVADDQHGQGVVQLVALLVCLVFQGLPQDSENINGRFPVRFLESTIESLILYFRPEGSNEAGVDFLDVLKILTALNIKALQFAISLIQRFLYILLELFELLASQELLPFQARVALAQLVLV